ncbi:hypothetical protein [Branchiibius sp. NY16-3462-2]|uniref:hypothetical protein n=1 Tax=Branchiibius sp. NY16-3462-2 TaxID=1807500 RepID=UPI00079242B2|nr:hypothetical protein [Branchiibius sp. NY16-3462-2]KYH45145.1 hypothetical protein AZH51_14790 [Branchiibius sp. NY16-3462-2]
MAPDLNFRSWRRPALLNTAQFSEGKPPTVSVGLTAVDSTGRSTTGSYQATFRWPGDVRALNASAIRHRAPAPSVQDAETTKFVHIDFWSPDLPWRYTPQTGAQLRPWLALLVAAPDELDLAANTLGASNRTRGLVEANATFDGKAFPPHLTAHLQVPDGEDPAVAGTPAAQRFSRLLSPRVLTPQTDYTALVIPAFRANGRPLWTIAGDAVTVDLGGSPIPVFDLWRFRSGEEGDFETLAARLWMPDPGQVGRASLTYQQSDGTDIAMEVRGALSSLKDAQPPVGDLTAVTKDLRSLTQLVPPDGGPEPIGMPQYGVPWVADPSTAPADSWTETLHLDPRERIHAGTGVRMGILAQEDLMRAATEQAGALAEARVRIAQLAAGLELGRRTYSAALPTDEAERIATLGPMTARLRSGDQSTVQTAITGSDSTLSAALLTGAGNRLLHRAPSEPGQILAAANEGAPPTTPDPQSEAAASADAAEQVWDQAGVDRDLIDRINKFLCEALRRSVRAGSTFRRQRSVETDPERIARRLFKASAVLLEELQQLLADAVPETRACNNEDLINIGQDLFAVAGQVVGAGTQPPPGGETDNERHARLDQQRRGFTAHLLTDGNEEGGIYGVLATLILRCVLDGHPLWPGTRRDHWGDRFGDLGFSACDPGSAVDLGRLSAALDAAIDPGGEQPPARARLGARLDGLPMTDLGPPRYPLGLDFPTWSLLNQYERDWLLPGADDLKPDSITALKTNPRFIDGYLVGLNTQFQAETRWRGMASDPTGTPLRMFFAPVDPATGSRNPDIIPIGAWPPGSGLGAANHLAGAAALGGGAERLVILFNSSLFRRYPRTVVYLHAAAGAPADLKDPPKPAKDTPPCLTGSITPDLVFFGFDIPAQELDNYWLVLDEPPAELRFRNDQPQNRSDSANFAASTIDQPTRVAISGADLRAWSTGQPGGVK